MSRKHKSEEALRACHVQAKHIATENLVVSHALQSPRLDSIEAKARQRTQALLVDLEDLKLRVRNLEAKTQYQVSDLQQVVITGAPIIIR
jgi:hypothetical protein